MIIKTLVSPAELAHALMLGGPAAPGYDDLYAAWDQLTLESAYEPTDRLEAELTQPAAILYLSQIGADLGLIAAVRSGTVTVID